MGDFGKGLKNFKKGMKDGDATDDASGVSDEAADAVYIEEGDEPAPKQTAVRAKNTTAKKSAPKKKTSKRVAAKKTASKKTAPKKSAQKKAAKK
jgi:hypothetical protein